MPPTSPSNPFENRAEERALERAMDRAEDRAEDRVVDRAQNRAQDRAQDRAQVKQEDAALASDREHRPEQYVERYRSSLVELILLEFRAFRDTEFRTFREEAEKGRKEAAERIAKLEIHVKEGIVGNGHPSRLTQAETHLTMLLSQMSTVMQALATVRTEKLAFWKRVALAGAFAGPAAAWAGWFIPKFHR